MPTYPPRSEPVKKQEELTKREKELALLIKKNIAGDKLEKVIDKYRQAQLSLIKAKIHVFKENEFQNKSNAVSLEKLEELSLEWADKTNEAIINEIKKE